MAVGGSSAAVGEPAGASAASSSALLLLKSSPAHGGEAQPASGDTLMSRGGGWAFILFDSSHFKIGPVADSRYASMKPCHLPFFFGSGVTPSAFTQPFRPSAS